ncbi:MAG: hypothetical protein Q8M11_19765 [Sulfuritalea sp.]|nr:hypothetical protein [Sulfuritalea sp.]MDP1985046.1 hypothetical protein [Sulfuritalea sp.]
MGFGSMFGGLFGKQSEAGYDKLSIAELTAKIAGKQEEAEKVRSLLERAGGDQAAMDKSRDWLAKMEQAAADAEKKMDMAALSKIKAEIAEAQKRRNKIEAGAKEMNDELLAAEDEIELLTRALAARQK